MDEKTKGDAQHVEQRTVTGTPENAAVKAVFSVGLTDSLVKDKHNPWSRSMLKLYGIMARVTLSRRTAPSLPKLR
jgi:D-aminopeptidase